MDRVIVLQAEADLVEIVGASGAPAASRAACTAGNSRANKHTDNRDHHQQLDQREAGRAAFGHGGKGTQGSGIRRPGAVQPGCSNPQSLSRQLRGPSPTQGAAGFRAGRSSGSRVRTFCPAFSPRPCGAAMAKLEGAVLGSLGYSGGAAPDSHRSSLFVGPSHGNARPPTHVVMI